MTADSSVGKNLRGGKVSALLSGQASHSETPGGQRWSLDCALCAVKNVCSDATFTLPGLLSVARPLQAEKDKKELEQILTKA